MKKSIKSIVIVLVITLITAFMGIGTVKAAESITVGKVWKVGGIHFRNTTNGDPAYCMNSGKGNPEKGDVLSLVNTYTTGPYVYILNDTAIAGTGANKSRTIKQKAIWYYKGSSIGGNYAAEAKKLANAAKAAGPDYSINPTITSITYSISFTQSEGYYISNVITIEMKDVKDNSYTVSFENAPEGTEVTNKNGLKFQVRVPVSSVKKSTDFTIKVKGAKSTYSYVKEYQKNTKLQNLSVPYSESKTPSITTKAEITVNSCYFDGTTYYGKDGNVVDEKTYNEECNPVCEIKDGVYYGKNHTVVTKEQYQNECNPTCEIKDGVYYGKNHNIVTKAEYYKECSTKKPMCEIVNGKYYDSKGNRVTKAKYNSDCNPTCKIKDGKYYDSKGNEVTKTQYKNDCEGNVVPVPDTGSKTNIASIAIGSVMLLGGAGAIIRFKVFGL